MRGNSFGKLFSLTSFGESHGEALGVVLDGVPPNLIVNLDDLQRELKRRAPGQNKVTTARKEKDHPQIISGVFENRTLGTPICVLIHNTNQRSEDYHQLKNEHRPGHADKTTELKYGIRDHRGGGRASGRETVARVIAGYFASLMLPKTVFHSFISEVGPFKLDRPKDYFNKEIVENGIPDSSMAKKVESFLLECKKNGESAGGKVQLLITQVPPGLGEPVFDKLKAELSHAMLSIGACVGCHFGLGEAFASTLGSEVSKDSDNFGGIEGGISNGDPITLSLTFKAPSTIGEKAKAGRHDPCILPRVLPVVEAMAKIVLADQYLRQKAYQI